MKGKILNVEKVHSSRALTSGEIVSLITALGCGAGEEFDLSRLRYGRIIIMTDADVDGAHILTLLLTFFYRFMRELVTNNFLFIAMPPLYKIKSGKTEKFVKDDHELRDQLTKMAVKGSSFYCSEASEPLSNSEFMGLISHYQEAKNACEVLEQRHDATLIHHMLSLPALPSSAALHDAKMLREWAALLSESANVSAGWKCSFEVQGNGARGWNVLAFLIEAPGRRKTDEFRADFFCSREYRAIYNYASVLHEKGIGEGAIVMKGEKIERVSSFREAAEWLFSDAAKGIGIQRYKGLGEMNPDQLWKTTMDPEKRRMVQVLAGDANMAEVVFDTLMGDEVAPRREFIERHALQVSNLDV